MLFILSVSMPFEERLFGLLHSVPFHADFYKRPVLADLVYNLELALVICRLLELFCELGHDGDRARDFARGVQAYADNHGHDDEEAKEYDEEDVEERDSRLGLDVSDLLGRVRLLLLKHENDVKIDFIVGLRRFRHGLRINLVFSAIDDAGEYLLNEQIFKVGLEVGFWHVLKDLRLLEHWHVKGGLNELIVEKLVLVRVDEEIDVRGLVFAVVTIQRVDQLGEHVDIVDQLDDPSELAILIQLRRQEQPRVHILMWRGEQALKDL